MMTEPRYCDFWLENRSKCPEVATHRVEDEYGAPLGFCRAHYGLASTQYHLLEPDHAD